MTDKNESKNWTEEDWKDLLEKMNTEQGVSYKEMASTILTSYAPPNILGNWVTRPHFKKQYDKGGVWKAFKEWLYSRQGECIECGNKLQLEVDHLTPIAEIGVEAADKMDNLDLRCKRCNVTKRFNHTTRTTLPLGAMQMWVVLTQNPQTFEEFKEMCKKEGVANKCAQAWARVLWNKQGE